MIMQRVIKFRAWDKTDRRMIVHEQEFIPIKVTSAGVLKLSPRYKEDLWFFLPYDRFEIMQFTGLYDKNKNGIYEGDIMEWDDPEQERGYIVYENNSCQFRIAFKSEYSTSCHIGLNIAGRGTAKVVGNICEHPHLLNQNQ